MQNFRWYFHRRLQVIAGMLWATVMESGSPIPFLGAESAPAGCKSQADRLLEDSLRMIRQDPYRLATILEAYASCALALHARLLFDPKLIRLPLRQVLMKDAIEAGLSRLQEMNEYRKPTREETKMVQGEEKNAEVDPNVLLYVNSVIDKTKEWLSRLENPLQVSTHI